MERIGGDRGVKHPQEGLQAQIKGLKCQREGRRERAALITPVPHSSPSPPHSCDHEGLCVPPHLPSTLLPNSWLPGLQGTRPLTLLATLPPSAVEPQQKNPHRSRPQQGESTNSATKLPPTLLASGSLDTKAQLRDQGIEIRKEITALGEKEVQSLASLPNAWVQ